ncbi:MAG: DUF3179 domain-containing protein [Chloroflexi bacterium]|nr:DUF3179 domain-containing protein [Chloroflexota bacterium]
MARPFLSLVALVSLLLAACAVPPPIPTVPRSGSPTATPSRPTIPPLAISTREWPRTDFTKYGVDLRDIQPRSVALRGDVIAEPTPAPTPNPSINKNGILPIYSPLSVTIEEAEKLEWMVPNHPVVAVAVNGEARAYPLGVLLHHEIVNDVLGGEPLAVTFSPYTASVLVFRRTVQEKTLAFGTTGAVRHANVVLWDDLTESWWQQGTGEAIVGEMVGTKLEQLPASVVPLAEFKASYPQGQVLSPNSAPSAYRSAYETNPYLRYDGPVARPAGSPSQPDRRLPATERVVGLTVGQKHLAVPLALLRDRSVFSTELDGQAVSIFYKKGMLSPLDTTKIATAREIGAAGVFDPHLNGERLEFSFENGQILDTGTRSTWSLLGIALEGPLAGKSLTPLVHQVSFWFAWAAFYSDTVVEGQQTTPASEPKAEEGTQTPGGS